jgi:hypothetical protein
LKHTPAYPYTPFAGIVPAEHWVERFVAWYNVTAAASTSFSSAATSFISAPAMPTQKGGAVALGTGPRRGWWCSTLSGPRCTPQAWVKPYTLFLQFPCECE